AHCSSPARHRWFVQRRNQPARSPVGSLEGVLKKFGNFAKLDPNWAMPTIHRFGLFRLDVEVQILFRGAVPRWCYGETPALAVRPGSPLKRAAVVDAQRGQAVSGDALVRSSSNALASLSLLVCRPSLNQPKTGASTSRAVARLPCLTSSRARSMQARSSHSLAR